jgi:hypothetical protein
MVIVPPIEITDSILHSTTAADESVAAWDSSTTYSKGDVVAVDTRKYESLIDSNADNYPPDWTVVEVGEDDAKWLDLGAINPWAMFDGIIATQTEASTDNLEVVLRPGELANGLTAFNIDASDAEVNVYDIDSDGNRVETVYSNSFQLVDNSQVTNWWSYFYAPIERQANFALLDLPSLRSNYEIEVIFLASTPAKCGQLVIGRQRTIGIGASYGTEVGIEDFSVTVRDDFGRAKLRKRRWAQTVSYNVDINTTDVSRAQQLLAAFRAEPVVYIGTPSQPSTIVYGFFRDFTIPISNPALSRANIEVEGLV